MAIPSGCLKKRCLPLPVVLLSVGGRSRPWADCRPLSPSTSMTTRPDGLPVAMPTLEPGHLSNQPAITSGSLVASLQPWRVCGCFPALHFVAPQVHAPSATPYRGRTAQPCEASSRAAVAGRGPVALQFIWRIYFPVSRWKDFCQAPLTPCPERAARFRWVHVACA